MANAKKRARELGRRERERERLRKKAIIKGTTYVSHEFEIKIRPDEMDL